MPRNIILDKSDALVRWYLDIKGDENESEEGYRAIGVDSEEGLLAIILFFGYTGKEIEIGVCSISPKWCSKKVLYCIFAYCFDIVQAENAIVRAKVDNTKSISLIKRLGFREVDNNDDEIVFNMAKKECKWVR